MLMWAGKTPAKNFFVPSKSKEGKMWKVSLWGDGVITCECPAGTYGKKKLCKHAQEKKNELLALFTCMQLALEHYINLKKQNYGKIKTQQKLNIEK